VEFTPDPNIERKAHQPEAGDYDEEVSECPANHAMPNYVLDDMPEEALVPPNPGCRRKKI
jgi:hypothetical protein